MLSGYRHSATEWAQPEDTRSGFAKLLDSLLLRLKGRQSLPKEPLLLRGLDIMPQGEAEERLVPTTINYNLMKQYNPYVAEAWRNGQISEREAQYIINQGRVPEWGRQTGY